MLLFTATDVMFYHLREAFTRALESLHRAQVRHHDIRPDNLTINSDGKVFIIDFDCADWVVRASLRADELMCLNDILEGKYEPGGYY